MIVSADLASVLAAVTDQDNYAVEKQLRAAEKAATESGDTDRADALELLASIMCIAVRPDDEANPFTAKLVMDGRRSMIPDDIVGEQSLPAFPASFLSGFHGGIMPPPASIHCGFGLDGVTETP
jgi:hypothetical protein